MQRGIDTLGMADKGVRSVLDRINEIDEELAALKAERAEAYGYLARLRDAANNAMEAARKGSAEVMP